MIITLSIVIYSMIDGTLAVPNPLSQAGLSVIESHLPGLAVHSQGAGMSLSLPGVIIFIFPINKPFARESCDLSFF